MIGDHGSEMTREMTREVTRVTRGLMPRQMVACPAKHTSITLHLAPPVCVQAMLSFDLRIPN